MKIQINEVWNGGSDGSKELAIIDVTGNPHKAVYAWIAIHRPDLDLCTSIYGHGFHAKEVE